MRLARNSGLLRGHCLCGLIDQDDYQTCANERSLPSLSRQLM